MTGNEWQLRAAVRQRWSCTSHVLPDRHILIIAIMAQKDAPVPKYIRFAFGGTAGYVLLSVRAVLKDCCVPRMAATLFVQPLDLVKNRMQLSGR